MEGYERFSMLAIGVSALETSTLPGVLAALLGIAAGYWLYVDILRFSGRSHLLFENGFPEPGLRLRSLDRWGRTGFCLLMVHVVVQSYGVSELQATVMATVLGGQLLLWAALLHGHLARR